jgi:hypothetical protein
MREWDVFTHPFAEVVCPEREIAMPQREVHSRDLSPSGNLTR